MTCGCKPVGFGASNNLPAGTLRCGVTVNGYTSWQNYPPGSMPPANASVCYTADGNGNLYPYQPAQPPWNQTPTVNISQAAVNNLFKNFTEGASQAWRQGSLVGNGLNAQDVGIVLNDMAIKVPPSTPFWNFTGPSQYAQSISTLQGMAWALSNSWLVITKQGAVILQSNDIQSGVVPPSFWEMYGKPLAIMATVVGGAAIAGGASAAGGAGASAGTTAGGLAPTTLSTAAPGIGTLAQPISLGTLAPVSGGGLTALAGAGASAGAGAGGIAGTAATVAGAAGGVLKTAGILTQLSALGKSPSTPSSGQPSGAGATPARSSSAGWIALAAAGAGVVLLAHFV